MSELDPIMMEDDDEAFCEGDPSLDDIDWDAVAELERRKAEAGDDPWKNLAILDEMYGTDLDLI